MVNEGVLYAITSGVGALTIGVVLNRLVTTEHKELVDKKLAFLMKFLLCFCMADMIWGILTSRLVLINQVVYTISTYLFHLGAALSAFLWAGYVIYYIKVNEKYIYTLNICRAIILSVQVSVLISNIWNKVFFYVDEDAVYHSYQLRNFMFYMQFMYYIILIVYCVIRLLRIHADTDKRVSTIRALVFSCVPLAFGFGQMLWPDAPMYSLGFMLTAVLIYSINVTAQREEHLAMIYETENNRLNELIAGISDDYKALVHLDLQTGKYDNYGQQGLLSDSLFDENTLSGDFFADIGDMVGHIVHEDDRKGVCQMLDREFMLEELAKNKSYSFNFRMDLGTQSKYFLCKVIKPSSDEDRHSNAIIGLFDDDLRIRKEMEQKEKLEAALDYAERANKAKTNFLFNMSHDIRTPMNAIIGFTTLAKKYIDDKQYLMECLDKVAVSGDHLLLLINDVLDMSRIESGRLEIVYKPECVRVKNEQVVSIVNELAVSKSIEFTTEQKGIDDLWIMSDALHLNQILLNILSNAIKYTPEGGRVWYAVENIGKDTDEKVTLRFVVKDNGIGMSKEFLTRIFDEFERENNATMSGVEGTGLGMSIVKNLVQAMGGTISVISEQGAGTTVECVIAFARTAPIEEHTERVSSDFNLPEGKRVLLVDDNALNREIAADILSEVGMVVEEATDGKEAYEKVVDADAGYYDIVFMDIQMPIMNGYEATKRIRALEDSVKASVPIVAMTANAFEEDKENAYASGMNKHLSKPINIDRIREVISELL